jgi:hypothetical protein
MCSEDDVLRELCSEDGVLRELCSEVDVFESSRGRPPPRVSPGGGWYAES